MDIARHTRNSARRDSAFGGTIAFVIPVFRRVSAAVATCCDQFTAIDQGSEIQILRIHAEPAFGQQQIAEHQSWALESVDDVEHLWDELEAIGDIHWSRDHSGIVPESGAKHLPEVALFRLGGNPRRGTGS